VHRRRNTSRNPFAGCKPRLNRFYKVGGETGLGCQDDALPAFIERDYRSWSRVGFGEIVTHRCEIVRKRLPIHMNSPAKFVPAPEPTFEPRVHGKNEQFVLKTRTPQTFEFRSQVIRPAISTTMQADLCASSCSFCTQSESVVYTRAAIL